jgi:hypothetical protein
MKCNKTTNYLNKLVINSHVKPALSRKQVHVTPVKNTGIKRHQTGISLVAHCYP